MAKVPQTSTKLLRDIADPQHVRWTDLYTRYQPMMIAFLRKHFPTIDADDVIQETFAALTKVMGNYRYDPQQTGSFHNYLTGVLRNKALNAVDAQRRQATLAERAQKSVREELELARGKKAPDWRETIYELALQQVLADESIQDRTKQVFIRLTVKGEAPAAVAESLGMTRNAVDQMKRRMIAALQERAEVLKTIC